MCKRTQPCVLPTPSLYILRAQYCVHTVHTKLHLTVYATDSVPGSGHLASEPACTWILPALPHKSACLSMVKAVQACLPAGAKTSDLPGTLGYEAMHISTHHVPNTQFLTVHHLVRGTIQALYKYCTYCTGMENHVAMTPSLTFTQNNFNHNHEPRT